MDKTSPSTPQEPVACANQISHLLYQHDPLNTLCNLMDNRSEYDIISDHMMKLLARGERVEEVVRKVLIFWFAEDLVDRRDRSALMTDINSVVVRGKLKPLLFANTEFAPSARDIARMGLFSTQQDLPLPDGFFEQSLSAQDAAIGEIIRKDFLDAEGRLDELGAIQGYSLYRPDGVPSLYTLDGEVDVQANEMMRIRRETRPLNYEWTLRYVRGYDIGVDDHGQQI
ncbi:MAG TPA: hypothetical protein VNQ97_09790 [Burkholderiaceae bacterium]|nr:hypothetical protein [Burkholderiaceae bacterium]